METNLMPKAYFEGKVVDTKDANVPIATNALQYGISCFAGIRGYNTKSGETNVFRLDDHVERLLNSTRILKFKVELTHAEVRKAIIDTVKANSPNTNVYIRPFFYRSDTGIVPSLDGDYQLGVYVLEMGDYLSTSKGLKACVSSWRRVGDNAIPARTKAGGAYVNTALAIEEAKRNGYDDAIFLDDSGHVAEGSAMNIFMVRNGVLLTPPVYNDILEGITRKTVMELARDNGVKVQERTIDRTELYIADEVFFAGTGAQVAWVESVDGRTITKKIGKMASLVQTEYFNVVSAKSERYSKWNTLL